MDSSTGQNSKKKNIWEAILAGIGYSIVGFIFGTVLVAIGYFTYVKVQNIFCFESCFFFVIFISSMVGIVIGIILGIIGGRRTYKRLAEQM